MTGVGRFGGLAEVTREPRGERPIDRLPEPDPQRQRSRRPVASLNFSDPCPLDADAVTNLLLGEAGPPARPTQIRA